MRLIKHLYGFILKSFLPLFAMTFFIVLFIVLMQFLWRYIDDLVGKGLSMGVIAELFFYAAVSMVPMALPLAILLASLMTFGNFGEKFELTAMKASGISLIKVMRPLIILIFCVAVGAFFFQNDILPKAQVKMWTLLFSMRQKSPEVEIPVGVFYDQIPGINLYVGKKDKETGKLYDVKIYDVRRGSDNVTILVSDSAQMALTPDMKYIYLWMSQGNQYERMATTQGLRNDPFRRETFYTKEILIPFDANFNRLDEGGVRDQYVGKNISQLNASIDSISARTDSLGNIYTEELKYQVFPSLHLGGVQSKEIEEKKIEVSPVDMDSIIRAIDPSRRSAVFNEAISISKSKQNQAMFNADVIGQEKTLIRRHGIELMKKFTLSVACLVFFFIGAPLGAIIRKGGLGMPLVISVMLFLIYYIIDNTGYKMARDGHIAVWAGMWLSTFILAPLGIFVTWKAMNDSAVFDPDRIKGLVRRIFHQREARSIAYKEIIIIDISIEKATELIHSVITGCKDYLDNNKKLPGYPRYFLKGYDRASIRKLSSSIEETITYLQDSRNPEIVGLLSNYPVISTGRLLHITSSRLLAYLLMIIFPIGVVLWLAGLRYGKLISADLKSSLETSLKIESLLNNECHP